MKKRKYGIALTLFCITQVAEMITYILENGQFPNKEFYNLFQDIEKVLVSFSQSLEEKIFENYEK